MDFTLLFTFQRESSVTTVIALLTELWKQHNVFHLYIYLLRHVHHDNGLNEQEILL